MHVYEMLETMDPREATILRMRFGLDDAEPRTLKEIGETLGLTRERVRRSSTSQSRSTSAAMTFFASSTGPNRCLSNTVGGVFFDEPLEQLQIPERRVQFKKRRIKGGPGWIPLTAT